jgi:hypothetical protein
MLNNDIRATGEDKEEIATFLGKRTPAQIED